MIAAIVLVLLVAVLAVVLRLGSQSHEAATPTAPPRGPEPPPDAGEGAPSDEASRYWDAEPPMAGPVAEEVGEEEPELVEAAAITSDGWSFVPHGDGVELVPPGEDDDLLQEEAKRHGSQALAQAAAGAPVNPRTGRSLVFWRPGMSLSHGDLIAARVVRGAPGVDPWRLEALGRDYDYQTFAFETEDAAQIALDLVVVRIVRPPLDEHRDPIPVGDEDFAVARRKYEETEQALAMGGDEQEPDDPANRG